MHNCKKKSISYNLFIDRFVNKYKISWRIVAGNLSFWYDSWCHLRPLCLLVPYVHISDIAFRVSDVFRDEVCDFHCIATPLSPELSHNLLSLCVHIDPSLDDLRVWDDALDGLFTVLGCYQWLKSRRHEHYLPVS